MSHNRLRAGRLTALHKNNINTIELLTKLNKAAKEKVNDKTKIHKRTARVDARML